MGLGLAGDAIKIGIVYEAANRQVIQNAILDTKKLQDATKAGTEEAKKFEAQEKRLREDMERQRAKIHEMRIAFLQFSAVMGTVGALYAVLSKNSDALKGVNERLATSFGRVAGIIGDELAVQMRGIIDLANKAADAFEKFNKFNPGAVGGAISAGPLGFFSNMFANKMDPSRVQKLNDQKQQALRDLESKQTQRTIAEFAIQTAQAHGDSVRALELQLKLKRDILEQDNKTNAQLPQMLAAFDKMASAQKEQLRMAELGLKTYQQIGKDFQKDVVGAFRSGVSDPIYDLLQGKKLNLQDMIEPLRSGINKAISTAIGDMFVTKAFGTGSPFSGLGKFFGLGNGAKADPAAKAVDEASKKQDAKMNEMIRTMEQVARCACNTAASSGITATGVGVLANNIGRFGGYSGISGITATLTGGGGGGLLSAIGGIAGGLSGLGGLVGGLGSLGGMMGGVAGAAGALPSGAGFSGGGFGSLPGESMHSGGWINPRRYASGGEVPAFVQPGEFVVRRGVAQENKDTLEAMHQGKPVKGTGGHVFLIKANDAQSFVEHLSTPAARAQLEIQVIKAIMGNGTAREVIKNYAK